MSDRSPEDEIMSEARKFAASMSATLRRYSQAANWLEKRTIRKEIKQAWRSELRQAELDRAHQLTWTANSIETFRAHSLAVARRANDPNVDHDRRYRDAQALARHRNDMAERVLRNPHLTEVEQGIALDGLDSATAFPHISNGHRNPLHRARRVKGIEALRYRAQVARAQEAAGIERPAVQPMRHVDRDDVRLPGQRRPAWQSDSRHPEDTERDALIEGLFHEANDLRAELRAAREGRSYDGPSSRELARQLANQPPPRITTQPIYQGNDRNAAELRDRGRDDLIGTQVLDPGRKADRRARAAELAREELAVPGGWIAEEDQRADQDVEQDLTRAYQIRLFAQEQADRALAAARAREAQPGRFLSQVSYLPEGADQVVHEARKHSSEAASAAWTRTEVDTIRPAPGTSVRVVAYGLPNEDRPRDVLFQAEGARSVLAQEVDGWREDLELRATEQEYDPATEEVEAAEREREFASLKDRHRLSIEHNNQLVERNAALVKQLSALTAERDELRETNSQLVDRLAADRTSTESGAKDWRAELVADIDADDDQAKTVLSEEYGRAGIEEDFQRAHRKGSEREADARAASDQEWADAEEAAAERSRIQRHYDVAEQAGHAAGQEHRNPAAQTYFEAVAADLDARERRDAKWRAERDAVRAKGRGPIPGHAFAGLVNGHEREMEMER